MIALSTQPRWPRGDNYSAPPPPGNMDNSYLESWLSLWLPSVPNCVVYASWVQPHLDALHHGRVLRLQPDGRGARKVVQPQLLWHGPRAGEVPVEVCVLPRCSEFWDWMGWWMFELRSPLSAETRTRAWLSHHYHHTIYQCYCTVTNATRNGCVVCMCMLPSSAIRTSLAD